MKKKIIVAGLMVATVMTIAACGNKKTTAETTTAVETTTEAETTVEATTEETIEETTEAEPLTVTQIKEFAEDVQQIVADEYMDWLADMCAYPMYISLEGGKETEILDREAFMELKADSIFTDNFLEAIAAVNLEELDASETEITMGDDGHNLTFSSVDGAPAIIVLNIND